MEGVELRAAIATCIGVSHGAYISISDTISDVLHAKPCKFVLGKPDYLLYSRGK